MSTNVLPWPVAPTVEAQPATIPQAAPTRPDISSLIQNIDSRVVKAASTPVSGPHAASLPSSLTTPIAPFQPQPYNHTPVVGKKAAKIQGIGNAITGVTNAIGQVTNKEMQIKQGQIKDAATRVIMAQQGIDEAKQALEEAHALGNTADVQKYTDLIQKNTEARDAVFADPKMRKALVKGFDISYTDPLSNKTEEHEAVQAAMKQAKTLQEKRQIMQQQQNLRGRRSSES